MKQKNLKNNVLNRITKHGNKYTSEKALLKSLKTIYKNEFKKNCDELVITGLLNSSPSLFLKKIRRKRKKTIEFPFILSNKSKISYGIKFMLYNCKSQTEFPFYKQLCSEIINSSKNLSKSVEKKTNLHKEAFIKKKIAHYRWF